MRPIIAVTPSLAQDEAVLQLNAAYASAILAADGSPIVLPCVTDEAIIAQYAELADGLLLSGGDDVDPMRFGEAARWDCGEINPLRDASELALCQAFLQQCKPILAICRGIQVLNVALGGTLHQHLPQDVPGSLAHRQKQPSRYTSHPVDMAHGSRLRDIFGGRDAVLVNSHHHQAVKALGAGLKVTAVAPDGVIEAVEHEELPFCIGVQWHPERLYTHPASSHHAALFKAFTDACKRA